MVGTSFSCFNEWVRYINGLEHFASWFFRGCARLNFVSLIIGSVAVCAVV